MTERAVEHSRRAAPRPGNADFSGNLPPRMTWDGGKRRSASPAGRAPRSPLGQHSAALGYAALRLHRTPEARKAFDRGLALAPTNLTLLEWKAMTYVAEGDLAGASAILKAAPKEVEPTALVAFVASDRDLVWVLDEGQRDSLFASRRAPSTTIGASGAVPHAGVRAEGRRSNVRKYAELARAAFEEQLKAVPEDAQSHAPSASRSRTWEERQRRSARASAVELLPSPRTRTWPLPPAPARARLRPVGENEKALDKLEPLLKIPYVLAPGWLRIDPNFDALRKNPRFQKLVAGAK